MSRTNRPMSEYENALFAVATDLARHITGNSDVGPLMDRLAESRDAFLLQGCTNAAAVVAMVMKSIDQAGAGGQFP